VRVQEMNGTGIKRLRSWTIALRQMFRSRSRQMKGEDEPIVLRSA
jgi:hypothetical protein